MVDKKLAHCPEKIPGRLRTNRYGGMTAHEWRKHFDFHPDGRMFHKRDRKGVTAGQEAGCAGRRGAWKVTWMGKQLNRSRARFLEKHGWLPASESGFVIDHDDMDIGNDDPNNLIAVSHSAMLLRWHAHNRGE